VAAPTANLPNFTHVYAEDFDTDQAIGVFPDGATYDATWIGYADWSQDTSHNGYYVPSKVLSTHDSYLDIYVHSEFISGVWYHLSAVPFPTDPASTAGGTGRLYGRVSVRAKSDIVAGYKTAWLFWPFSGNWPAEGEIDFPEGALGGPVNAYLHWAISDTGSPDYGGQDAFESLGYSADVWHTYTTEWKPGEVKFYVDDVLVGTATKAIPSTRMYWALQTETATDGVTVPTNEAAGHVLIDWVSIWDYTPGSPGATSSTSHLLLMGVG